MASAIDGYAVLADGRGGAALTSLDPEASGSPGRHYQLSDPRQFVAHALQEETARQRH